MISREQVIWGYRFILGRDPENNAVIDYHCQHESTLALRKALLESEEFLNLHPQLSRQQGDISFPDWNDLRAPRLIFMHSPKTGGTTLHHLLLSHFPNESVCPERFNGLKNHAAGALAKYRFFSGHYDLVSCLLVPGEKQIVTLLREPVSRLISMYNFLRAHRPDIIERNNWQLAKLASSLKAEDFFSHPSVRTHPYINNGMTRTLTASLPIEIWPIIDPEASVPDVSSAGKQALEQLSTLTAFGVLERYEESVDLIFNSLRLERPESIQSEMVLSDLIAGAGNYQPVEIVKESTNLRSIIEELVPADIELYRGAVTLFESRLRQASS